MGEPGFLKFEPGFWIEVVEFVWAWHKRIIHETWGSPPSKHKGHQEHEG